MAGEQLGTERKALQINLDKRFYGTIAEIGAGQEVARYFFKVGGAAGTIAKTMSAYDMTFSDAIYGKAERYVSQKRLLSMLDHEFQLLKERLSAARGDRTCFFVFADTVAVRSFRGTDECHGWMGIRFQFEPLGEPHDIILHVRMLDKEKELQQTALGIIGVNVIHNAANRIQDQDEFITALIDDLNTDRIEVDMLIWQGPRFGTVDNRLLSLKLVHHDLTNAIMFGERGELLQPSEALRNRPVFVQRGRFRPVTLVNINMLEAGREQFMKEAAVQGKEVVVLAELTFNNLISGGSLYDRDFLARADVLSALGYRVLISDYPEYYRLVSYFRRYTKEMIGMVMGVNILVQLFDEKYYEDLEGGILESFGRLFRHQVKLYVHPMTEAVYRSLLELPQNGAAPVDRIITLKEVVVAPHLQLLFQHLVQQGYFEDVSGFDQKLLSITSPDVLRRIKEQDSSWETQVPQEAARIIKERKLF